MKFYELSSNEFLLVHAQFQTTRVKIEKSLFWRPPCPHKPFLALIPMKFGIILPFVSCSPVGTLRW